MIFASLKQSAGKDKRETPLKQTFKCAKCMAFKKVYFHGVWAAIETVRLGFAFYMITDNDLKADSLISHTCN